MKALLLLAASGTASAAAILFLRTLARLGAFGDSLIAEAVWTPDGGFPRLHLLVALPIAVFSLAALAVLGNAPTNEGQVIGLLLTSLVMAAIIPKLSGELVFWSHRATRLDHEREAAIIQRLRRAGFYANEVWLSPGPAVLFWKANLLSPAIVAGTRVMITHEALALPASRLGGIAIAARRVRTWPWALWPIAVAIELRVRFQAVVPIWMFIAPAVAIGFSVVADLATHFRARASLRTDATAADVITGALDLAQIEARMVAGRGRGRFTIRLAERTLESAVRRARRLGGLAGLVDAEVVAITGAVRPLADQLRAARRADTQNP